MQRSSPSIAALATALAKAQIELANPEKSLIGTIEAQNRAGGARQFRYAPLSSGLETVRKTLGQHEIATVQTTAVDQATGVINLTTMLAHSSGEWIASDWPVCAIAETERPHRMGAALIYARRYALFTLVGIAGEDDLDAPDLIAPMTSSPRTDEPPGEKAKGRPNGGPAHREKAFPGIIRQKNRPNPTGLFDPNASAALREQLIAEMRDICSAEQAAAWGLQALAAKNTLLPADAERVESAFQVQLSKVAAATPTARRSQAQH